MLCHGDSLAIGKYSNSFELLHLLKVRGVMVCLLASLSLQRVEIAVQEFASHVEDRKGKRALDELKGVPKAEMR